MPVFKQNVSKEEKLKVFLVNAIVAVIASPLIILSIVTGTDLGEVLTELGLIMAYLLLMLLVTLRNFEWFLIYEDRIEAKTIYGTVNKVYYKNLISIYEADIYLTRSGVKRRFYIFNDGRNNHGNFFSINSCINNKKYNLRIRKTAELEEYIENHISKISGQ